MSLSEQELLRRESRAQLLESGINPYPAEGFKVSHHAQALIKAFEQSKDSGTAFQKVQLAGRLMGRRLMGAASFVELEDSSGRIQLYVRRDTLCPHEDKSLYNELFKKHIALGDIIGVVGKVFRTQRGEVSVEVHGLKLLAKSVRPLPVAKQSEDETGNKRKHDAFTGPEARYRQRYVDLVVNAEQRLLFARRTKLMDALRSFLNAREYLEVETPILQPIWGGAAARPFVTHHETLNMPLYLRIANELYLKRLIVGGYDAVYEFSKDFRNEGMSRFHNPEFTQVELYVAYKDYKWMATCVEEMLCATADALHGCLQFPCGDQIISFERPWATTTFYGALQEHTGRDLAHASEAELRATAQQFGLKAESTDKVSQLLDKLFGHCCEPTFINPTFVFDYPEVLSPLAKAHRSTKGLVERFEVICNGKEICNAYSELNDPIVQRQRLEEQLALARGGDKEAPGVLDEDFLRALEYGMPPTAGLGVGIDRLSMLLLNAPSIQDVLFFPQMRPE